MYNRHFYDHRENLSIHYKHKVILLMQYGSLLYFTSIVTNGTNKMHTLQCFNLQNSYIFRASLAHHQGVQLYKAVARPFISNIRNCCEIINVCFTEGIISRAVCMVECARGVQLTFVQF